MVGMGRILKPKARQQHMTTVKIQSLWVLLMSRVLLSKMTGRDPTLDPVGSVMHPVGSMVVLSVKPSYMTNVLTRPFSTHTTYP